MNPTTDSSRMQTIEQALFERLGVTVDDVVATGTDLVDESVSRAGAAGIEVDVRMSALADLLERLTRPETMASLQDLISQLPQLAQWAQLAKEIPNLLAAAGDFLDEQQKRLEQRGIDVEKGLTGSVNAILQIGSAIRPEMFAASTLDVVGSTARSLGAATQEINRVEPKRIGLLGLIRLLRDPAIQKSLAFAIEFGKSFGRDLEETGKT